VTGRERTNRRAEMILCRLERQVEEISEECEMVFGVSNRFLSIRLNLGNHGYLQSAPQRMCCFAGGVGRPPLFNDAISCYEFLFHVSSV
jgi:hypothetical protein